ncbi:MAG: diacylglycerol kinase family lipid kinase [Rhodospirillaceae bacterium]|nr:MAG: diacylglycerol kinase family lipid kinase [Rhodospirillaceae bacterium]
MTFTVPIPHGDPASYATTHRRILVVFNPTAGRRRRPRLDAVVAALRARGCIVTVMETMAPGHASDIARAVTQTTGDQAMDVIAVAGGDGTINEVVNGLVGTTVALGVIPLGTANVLADEIGLPRAPKDVARILAEGPVRPIRVGIANGRRFVMMAGAGFDASVVDSVSLSLKRRLGPLAYVWQTLKRAFTDTYAACEVMVDGVPYRTVSAVVCNGRHYGGPFVAARSATLTDGLLHVILLQGRGWLSVARYGLALLMGRLDRLSDVRFVSGRHVVVSSGGHLPVQADGDIITTLPADVTVDPAPVALVWPR